MKSILKILKLIHKLEPRLLPVTVLDLICKNIPPYIDTLLTAYVLDRLLAGDALKELMPPVLGVLALRLALKAIEEITQQIIWAREGLVTSLFQAKRGEKTLAMDYETLNSTFVNDLRGRMMSDDLHGWGMSNIYYMFSDLLGQLISMCAAVIIVAPMLIFSLGSVTYLAAVAAAVTGAAVLNGKFLKKRQKIEDSYSECRSYSSYYLWGGSVDYKMGKDIRIYSAQPMIENAVAMDKKEQEGRRRYIRYSCSTASFNGVFTGLLEGSSYIYVVLCAVKGALSAGSVVKFAAALYRFWGSLSGFTTSAAELAQYAARLDSTLSFLELPDPEKKKTPPEAECYEFEFKNVSFTYPGGEDEALSNISCRLRSGEKIAVVGLNGSGKTTFIKLLCRLYHPSKGKILLNGEDIEEYDFDAYIKLLSVVFQDFRLFSFTLGENVAAAEEYDPSSVRKVLETAGFGDRLSSLEKGCETVLYKGFDKEAVDISGGEAQKIALARALYKDAPFMILDEPTAALDPVAEYEIYSGFNRFTAGKGAVYISHRLSSCVFCDRVLVFEGGKIVQSGPHKQLLEEDGLYRRLWDAQAQYYTE